MTDEGREPLDVITTGDGDAADTPAAATPGRRRRVPTWLLAALGVSLGVVLGLIAAALVAEYGIATFARRGEDRDTYYRHLNQVADTRPQITMDDGCDLVSLLHSERPDQLKEVLAGTEETTTGVSRLKAMAADGALRFPVVAVNEAQTKHLFDNRYGTGQSTVDGILRATNVLLAGRKVVIAGASHHPPVETPAAFNRLLLDFLR